MAASPLPKRPRSFSTRMSTAGRTPSIRRELFLAAIAACINKGIERVTPMLKFDLRGVEVKLHGIRQDSPPKMVSIDYELIVDTDETDQRLELLHTNVRKYGTISNTVAEATKARRRYSEKGINASISVTMLA